MWLVSAALVITACNDGQPSRAGISDQSDMLVGAWRSKIEFRGGPLAGMKDLEFLHSYNAGGTMTESSNYDEAPNSSPPAYGIWRQTASKQFQTKYVFYTTKEQTLDGVRGSDWWPAGHGVLTEVITLSADGQSYSSTIKLVTYDTAGGLVPNGSGEGTGSGTRIVF
jgi:hypothetical protein